MTQFLHLTKSTRGFLALARATQSYATTVAQTGDRQRAAKINKIASGLYECARERAAQPKVTA